MLKKIRMNSLNIIKTCVNLPQRSNELSVLLAIMYALLYDSQCLVSYPPSQSCLVNALLLGLKSSKTY